MSISDVVGKMSYKQLEAKDTISKDPVNQDKLADIIDRLHTTGTIASKRSKNQKDPNMNKIARTPATEEEMNEIFGRLATMHTKSSSGGQGVPPYEHPKTPGIGTKTFPVIEGLDERFKGSKVPKEKEKEVIERLHTAKTKAEEARLDNPRILLYPERTLLCNNVERIRTYQDSGQTVKQAVLERREKWFI